MGTNAKIMWRPRITESGVVITSSGDTTNYPVTNVKVQQRSEVWRSRINPATGRWGSPDFTGTGLNDLTLGGTYSGAPDEVNYRVQIDGVGTPNTFKWSDNGGATFNATAVAITASAQTLNNGVTITFGATTGHTLNDRWDFKAGEPFINVDFGQEFRFAALGLVFDEFRLTTSGKIRIRLSKNSDLSLPDLDVTIDMWRAFFTLDGRPDGLDSEIVTVDGLPQAATISLFPKPVRVHRFTEISDRYLRVNFKDSTNTDGFVEIAYLFPARTSEPEINFSYGHELGRIEEARVDESGGGQLWMDRLFQKFRTQMTFEFQTEAQATGFWMFVNSFAGMSRELIVTLQDSSVSIEFWTTYYCHAIEALLLRSQIFNRYEVRVSLEELI